MNLISSHVTCRSGATSIASGDMCRPGLPHHFTCHVRVRAYRTTSRVTCRSGLSHHFTCHVRVRATASLHLSRAGQGYRITSRVTCGPGLPMKAVSCVEMGAVPVMPLSCCAPVPLSRSPVVSRFQSRCVPVPSSCVQSH